MEKKNFDTNSKSSKLRKVRASLLAQMVTMSEWICLQCGRLSFDPWIEKTPWRRAWQPTPVFLPGEFQERSGHGGLQSMESQRGGHDWATNTHTPLHKAATDCRHHGSSTVKAGLGLDPWARKTPWRRAWQPTPVFLPGESYGQRSLVGYKESDTTEAT